MAFTPLAAVAVSQRLWPTNAPSKIGAFLLMAYAAGAVIAPLLLKKLKPSQLLQVSLFSCTICLIIEIASQSVDVWLGTRSILGFFGACLMVSGPILALSLGTPSDRSNTQLWTFSGIGLGACVSATLLEIRSNLIIMLLPIMLFCLWLSVSSLLWAKSPPNAQTTHKLFSTSLSKPLIAAYGLDAIAYIPATVYLSDYVSNELHLKVGNSLWQLFGLGAILGPWLATILTKRIGSSATLNITYGIKTLALLVLACSQQIELLSIASAVTGVCVPAIVLLTAAELRRTLEAKYFSSAWSLATSIFACSQAVGAITMALCFQLIGTYKPMFLVGALLLVPACYLTLRLSESQS